MTGDPIRLSEPSLNFRPLTKEFPVADVNDPSNTAVKPSIESLEGKIYLAVSLLTAISAALGTILAAYPESKEVKIAAMVIAVLMAAASAFTAQRFGAQRRDVKQTANLVAGGLAMADKAISIAKEHPELARDLFKAAVLSDPTSPAST